MGSAQILIETPFKNEHFSVSRIKVYEKCPLAFKLHYIDDLDKDVENEAGEFGKLLHKTKELVYQWIVAEEFSGTVPDEIVTKAYREAFREAPIAGEELYREGLKIARNYFAINRDVDHMSVLAIERAFIVTIESDDGKTSFTVIGYIDRVDRVSSRRVRIVDYKTNRMLFTRDELSSDLQMSIYGLAVKALWPWVEEVEYAFDMLRHNIRQTTQRTEDDLNRAADYVIALGSRIESALEFKAKLNPLCPWCAHRERCDAYNEALQSGETNLSYLVAADNLVQVSEERERAASLEAIGKQRKKEMDKILMARMRHDDLKELVVGDMRYIPVQQSDTEWPTEKTVAAVAEALAKPKDFVRERITVVHKGLIESLLGEAELPRARKQLLNAKLETIVTKNQRAPWLKGTLQRNMK